MPRERGGGKKKESQEGTNRKEEDGAQKKKIFLALAFRAKPRRGGGMKGGKCYWKM